MLGTSTIALLAVAASVNAQTGKYCPGGTTICFSESKIPAQDITFRIAIPETASATAPFDILLQIVAPVKVAWAGLAWGGSMANNPLTVGWPSGKGAVVSSRIATGHVSPSVYTGATYTVLPTTSTNATHWQLDVLCKGCSKWSAGSLDPAGAVTLAWAKGSRAVSTPASNTSSFSYHDARGSFSHDLSSAKIPQGIFDAVAYDLANPAPASSAPVATGVATSVVTLPGGNLPTTSILTLPGGNLPTTNILTLPGGNLPTTSFPGGVFPTDVPFPTTNIFETTLPFPLSSVPRPALTTVPGGAIPTRLTALPPFTPPGPSTTFVIITKVTTLPKPTTPKTVTVPPPVKTTTQAVIVTVTVTKTPTETEAPPVWQPGYGPPPWVGKGKWGKGKWGRRPGNEIEEPAQVRRRRR